jgi:streptogramin lyase
LSILRNRSRCCLVFWSFRDRVCLPAAASIDTILDGTSVVFIFRPNPLDKSFTEIGPDLGDGWAKWKCGVLANNSSIYCAPFLADHILKIDTIQGTVETLDNVRLPETGINLWRSGALAQDNHIYYMPFNARRIMRLNPDNDSLSSVGDDLGEDEAKYTGTVVGSDDCVYGIPNAATHIVKFDPANPDTTSTVGEEAWAFFECGNDVLGCDGYIWSSIAD